MIRTDEQLRDFARDPRWVHFAGMMMRPGVINCCVDLEHTHYKPGTSRNDLFQMHLVNFADTQWVLVSIPREEREFMERAASANGLRIADGVPTCISPQGISQFPVRSDRVYTLENVSGHPVYGKRPEQPGGRV